MDHLNKRQQAFIHNIHKFITGILHVIKPTVTILQPFLYICRNKKLRAFSQKSVKLSLIDLNPRQVKVTKMDITIRNHLQPSTQIR